MARQGISRMATGRPNGRPPKPLEQKRASGNPGKRKLPNAPLPGEGLSASVGIPVPPSTLGEAGLALWNHVWDAGQSWLSVDSERTMIVMLCEAQDEYFDIYQGLRNGTYDRVYTHSNGSIVTSPYVTQLKDLRSQMTAWLSDIGFSTSARSRLGLSEVRVRDEMDELERRRLERASGA
jgi:P27 family predicted phage terminase small subunit